MSRRLMGNWWWVKYRVSYWRHYIWLTFRSKVLRRPVTKSELLKGLAGLRNKIPPPAEIDA